jgi:hypothetical protein
VATVQFVNKYASVERLQSNCIVTQFHWSSSPPVCFSSWGTRVQSPGGDLCETGILQLVLSRYIGNHSMIDHCGIVWGGLRLEPPLGYHAYNVIILLSPFHTRCRSSFRLHNRQLLGGSPVESLQSHCILTQFQWSSGPPLYCTSHPDGPRFNPQGGTYVKLGFSCSRCLATQAWIM